MSYAFLGLGAPNPAIVRPPECTDTPESGGLSYCIGYEESCPNDDQCCPPQTWFNAVYEEILGHAAARAVYESRVRAAGHLLLAPVDSDPTGIDRFAYDQSAVVPGGLVERTRAAFQRFELAFPAARWHFDPTDVRSDHCGTYGGWDEVASYPDSRIAAWSRLSGAALDKAFVDKLRAEGLRSSSNLPRAPGAIVPTPSPKGAVAPPALAKFFADTDRLVRALPGNRPTDVVDPSYEGNTVHPVVGDLLVGQKGQVVPSAWLKDFILLFEDKLKGPTASRAPGDKNVVQPPWQLGRGGAAAVASDRPARALMLLVGTLVVGAGAYGLVRMGRWG